jgi:hypothetical protein
MILVKASKDSEAGVLPTKGEFDEMGRFNKRMIDAGVMLTADGLHPSSRGCRVMFSADGPKVIEGPFGNPSDIVSGFWLIEVKNKEEALEWATQVPFKDGEVEVRKIYERSDFPPEVADSEALKQEEEWRGQQEAGSRTS